LCEFFLLEKLLHTTWTSCYGWWSRLFGTSQAAV